LNSHKKYEHKFIADFRKTNQTIQKLMYGTAVQVIVLLVFALSELDYTEFKNRINGNIISKN